MRSDVQVCCIFKYLNFRWVSPQACREPAAETGHVAVVPPYSAGGNGAVPKSISSKSLILKVLNCSKKLWGFFHWKKYFAKNAVLGAL